MIYEMYLYWLCMTLVFNARGLCRAKGLSCVSERECTKNKKIKTRNKEYIWRVELMQSMCQLNKIKNYNSMCLILNIEIFKNDKINAKFQKLKQ